LLNSAKIITFLQTIEQLFSLRTQLQIIVKFKDSIINIFLLRGI